VVYGRLLRATDPYQQLVEIIKLFGLQEKLAPFSRCMVCNEPLQEVEKKTIRSRLLPLTDRYYHEFSFCPACSAVYWPGSHRKRMEDRLAELEILPSGKDGHGGRADVTPLT
jgi:uncharacterized protein with PIN domain